MIKSFGCKRTQALYEGRSCHRPWRAFRGVAERKLLMLDAARSLDDLRAPPNNRLEKLKRDRAGQHAIRINGQFRVCFVWAKDGPTNVEIVDDH